MITRYVVVLPPKLGEKCGLQYPFGQQRFSMVSKAVKAMASIPKPNNAYIHPVYFESAQEIKQIDAGAYGQPVTENISVSLQ